MVVYAYDELVVHAEFLRCCGARLAYAHGCFDCLTVGHILHLAAAARDTDCSRLFVTVTADEFIDKPGRPIFSAAERAEVLAGLRAVAHVAINPYPTAVEPILQLRPAYYVKGGEYRYEPTPALLAEQAAIESIGGKLMFTDTIERHTTELLEKLTWER